MDDKEFQREVIENLAGLNAGQMEIVRRLDDGEKKFTALYERTEHNREMIFQHATQCPLKGEVVEVKRALDRGEHPGSAEVRARLTILETHTAGNEAKGMFKRNLIDFLKPAIWLFLGIFFTLMMIHSEALFDVKPSGAATPAAVNQK